MDNHAVPITPASSDLEQEKEARNSQEELSIDDYDKTVADSFPASDPPSY